MKHQAMEEERPRRLRRQENRATCVWAGTVIRGHRAAGFTLLLGGVLLSICAGAAPLLVDIMSSRAAAALPDAQTPGAALSLQGLRVGFAVAAALLTALLCAPLRLGREAWYFGGAEAKRRSSKRVLFWLQPRWAFKAARFVLALLLRKLLWAGLYLLPGGFLLGGTLWQARVGSLDWLLFAAAAGGGALLLALGLGFYAATVQRYALVLPILTKQPRCKLNNALRLSAARTDGSCAALLGYSLRFWPWYLLCLLVIPLPFAAPYITQAKACRRAELLRGGLQV